MCGISGVINFGTSRDNLCSQLSSMLKTLRHRGPDDSGIWLGEPGVAFGHQRLSILDLSPAGHQPMESSCGRFVIIFNGEIYNHLELRKYLEKTNSSPLGGWRGHSDTETLLTCFAIKGIEKTLQSTVGMFALALWDKYEKKLTLARDRIGEKPLYYGWQNETFLFGSELKSLRVHSSFKNDVDWHAASTFLRLNYIPAPSSIYRGIFKLVPGTYIQLTQNHIAKRSLPNPISYYSLNEAAKYGLENPFSGSFSDAVDELETLIRNSVQMQSVADVPVGAFLSGGIDSSTIVAMMKSATTSKVTTFSIGMPDSKMDESKHASAVAKHLGTDHIEHIIQPHEALELIPILSLIWDEPFGDSSQIPTYLVSKLAKQKVTVALSGDGGDEFFLGYPRYSLYQKLWRSKYFGKLPANAAFAALSLFSNNQKVSTFLRHSKSIVEAWRQSDTQELNIYWTDRYRKGDVPLTEQIGVPILNVPIQPYPATTAGLWDAGSYLPDDILVKVDRSSMAHSLETRAPLLDHRIIEFAYSLPMHYKLEHGVGKKILRSLLYRYVPQILVNRPKMGFGIPLASWLRIELKPWVEDLLEKIPQNAEFFNKPMIDKIWQEHLSGQREHTEQLWGILSLLGFLK